MEVLQVVLLVPLVWEMQSFDILKYQCVSIGLSFFTDAEEKDIISSAFPDFEAQTCIKFKQRTTEKDYINISPQNG